MKIFMALLLSLLTLLFPLPDRAGAASSVQEAVPAARVGGAEPSAPSAVDYAGMEYVHYDPEDFHEKIGHLRALAALGNAETVNWLYDRLYDEFQYISALTTLAMLNYDADYNSEYWSEEYAYVNTLFSEVQDALLSACSYILETDCGPAFTEHIGAGNAAALRGHREMSGEELDLLEEEIDLLDRYYALYDDIEELSCRREDGVWTLRRLFGPDGSALAETDYDAYLDIYHALQENLTETFAPLYIRLAEIWDQEAEAEGYDSYIDYAYDMIYWRDYTPEDAQRLCDAVKPIARAYYAELYYSGAAYAADAVSPVLGPEALLDVLEEYLPRVDEALLTPWNEMVSRGLYDLAPDAPGRLSGAYTTVIQYYRAPFMFASLSESCYDLTTITHEFGHFSDFWFNPPENALTEIDDMDLAEVHSNALQALFTEFYDEIYDSGAETAEFINLSLLLENVIDGCLYDEFQRRALADPSVLTPEELNRIYTEVRADYGIYDAGSRPWDGSWIYISHNFAQPLYYISYAVSALAALQIWDLAQSDFDAAADMYMDVLRRGAHDTGYLEVLRDCGLRLFTEEGAAEDICRPVLERLTALDRAAS